MGLTSEVRRRVLHGSYKRSVFSKKGVTRVKIVR
jgi:hypothetical protein